MKYTGTQLLENAPVSTAIIRLSLPMMAAMLAQAIYIMTDMFFLGQTGNPNMVAAVAIIYSIIMLTVAVGSVFAIGGSSYISRMLGLKNTEEAKNTSSVCFYMAIISGLIITILLFYFKTYIVTNLGVSEKTLPHVNGSYSIYILTIPFAIATILLSGLLRSEGETGKAFILQIIGMIINIIFDYIFILIFDWGTKGSAWGTLLGQLTSFIYGVWYLLGKKTSLSIAFKNNKPNKIMIKDVLFIGIPAGLSNLLNGVAFMLSNRIAAGYGDKVVAGYGIMHRIVNISIMIIIGLTMGFQPFAGFNFGAKNIRLVRQPEK